MPVDAVVFDYGGVLLSWDPRHLYRKLFADPDEMEFFLAEVGFAEWNLEQDRGRPWDEAVAELSAQFPHRAQLIAAYHERWAESIEGPIDGTVAVLEELVGRGIPCYGLTNFSGETYRAVLDMFDFFGLLSGNVVSGDEGVVKPDPAIYKILCDRYDLTPGRTLFVDDAVVNVDGAVRFGLRALQFTGPGELRLALERHFAE